MEKLGQLLKSEREKRGLSLHEIGMSLKINPKILKSIEDNDSKNLPAKTFLRGFVRSYAQYLRIDVNLALKLFQEQYGSTRPEDFKPLETDSTVALPPVTETVAHPTTNTRFEKPLKKNEDLALPQQSGSRWLQISAAIVILVMIAFVVKMIDKYQRESEIAPETTTVTSPIDTTTTTIDSAPLSTPMATTPPDPGMSSVSSSTTSSTLAAIVVASSTTTTSLKSSTTTAAPSTTTMKPTTTSTTSTSLKPTTTTTTTTTTLKPTTTTVKATTTTTLSTTSTTLSAKNLEVIVEALNNVQIKYTLGDDSVKTMDLSADQVHTFKSKTKVQLDVSDGGAINVIVNGRDRGVPGTIGKPTKLTYP